MPIPTAVLRTRIIIRPYQGTTGTGQPVYGDPIARRARWVGKRKAVRTREGVDVIASATADIRPNLTVPAESQVTRNDQIYEVLDVIDVEDLERPWARQLILEGPKP